MAGQEDAPNVTQCVQEEEDTSDVLQDNCNDPNLEDNNTTNIFGDEEHEKIQQYRYKSKRHAHCFSENRPFLKEEDSKSSISN